MNMNTIQSKDGTQIFYKDWGTGRPVVFSHGWPLDADAWDAQMLFLASHGLRVIAHDRRGHGRSCQPWNGNDMDTYADDLAALIEDRFPARATRSSAPRNPSTAYSPRRTRAPSTARREPPAYSAAPP